MKAFFYIICRDGHDDSDPYLYGPYKTLAEAKQEANDLELAESRILTIISISDQGVVIHEAVSTSSRKWTWK